MGARAFVLAGLTLAAGCTPFDGRERDAGDARPADAARVDAPTPPASDGGTSDRGAFTCGQPSGGCDPVHNAGCDDAGACVVTTALPLRAACGTAGAHQPSTGCAAEADCAAGSHCVNHRCLPLCCAVGGDAWCRDQLGPWSHCALPIGSGAVYACTLPGVCDYTDRSEAHGGCEGALRCYPSFSNVGLGECRMPGVRAVGDDCIRSDDCVSGATCAGKNPGVCLPICNPRSPVPECPNGMRCGPFVDRPLDYGVCS
jgi:hypothetical protein